MHFVYFVLGAAGLTLVFVVIRHLLSPLRRIPGPFLARFTDGWYLWRVNKGHFELDNLALHAKYGEWLLAKPSP